MVKLQFEHQTTVSQLMGEKFSIILNILIRKMEDCQQQLKTEKSDRLEKIYKVCTTLYCEFDHYCDRLPVISFNSQRYEIPLIRQLEKGSGIFDIANKIVKKTTSSNIGKKCLNSASTKNLKRVRVKPRLLMQVYLLQANDSRYLCLFLP